MSKITIENKKGKIIITNRLSYPETVNERVVNSIASGVFENFLPLSIQQKRNETRIECSIQGLMPLSQYLGGSVTRSRFLDFVHSIALMIKTCDKHMLNVNNLALQSDMIFFDPQARRIKCIFWPVVNNQGGNPPHEFLKQLPATLTFDSSESTQYRNTYSDFFKGVQPFSVNSFERMILTLQGKQSTSYSAPSESLSPAPVKKENPPKKTVNIEYDPFAQADSYFDDPIAVNPPENTEHDATACPACGAYNQTNSNFCIQCGTKLNGGNSTDLSFGSEQPSKSAATPSLRRLRTYDAFVLDRSVHRIGSDPKRCDIVITNSNFISRFHAEIHIYGDRYYIIDQNSRNKT